MAIELGEKFEAALREAHEYWLEQNPKTALVLEDWIKRLLNRPVGEVLDAKRLQED